MARFRFNHPTSPKLTAERMEFVYATRWDRVPIASEISADELGWLMKTEGETSVYGYFPWASAELGELMIQTTTLAVRSQPYDLPTELARGALNQTQNYMAECEHFGLQLSASAKSQLDATRRLLAQVVTSPPGGDLHTREAEQVIEQSLALNTSLAECLAKAVAQSQSGHLGQPLRGVTLDCLVQNEQARDMLRSRFGLIHIPIRWSCIESQEGRFDWSMTDRLFEEAESLCKSAVAGPILNHDATCLPVWALKRRDQFDKFRDSVSRFVNQVAARYAARVDKWHAVAGLNTPSGLGLNDQLRILLAAGIVERLRRSDPETPRLVSIDKPWGEYLSRPNAALSPTGFLDALIRADIGVDSVGLELNFDEWQRGSFWRHPLTVIQRINEFASLEKPVTILLRTTDEHAEAAKQLDAIMQTNTSIEAVVWNQWSESKDSAFPASALWTESGPSLMLQQMPSAQPRS